MKFDLVCCIMFLSDVPSAPENLAVTETSKSFISLSWSPPASDGGTPVTGYQVERCLAGSSRWLRVGKSDTTNYTDKEVVEDTDYQYQVSAENKVGVGPPSEPTRPVTAKDPWSKFLVIECR
jgi:Fibronectin type III domain